MEVQTSTGVEVLMSLKYRWADAEDDDDARHLLGLGDQQNSTENAPNEIHTTRIGHGPLADKRGVFGGGGHKLWEAVGSAATERRGARDDLHARDDVPRTFRSRGWHKRLSWIAAADDPTHPDVDAQAAAQPRLPPMWETMTTYRKP
jgi:hypothetical protein